MVKMSALRTSIHVWGLCELAIQATIELLFLKCRTCPRFSFVFSFFFVKWNMCVYPGFLCQFVSTRLNLMQMPSNFKHVSSTFQGSMSDVSISISCLFFVIWLDFGNSSALVCWILSLLILTVAHKVGTLFLSQSSGLFFLFITN